MNHKRMKDALEIIAQRHVPENNNLWPEISTRLQKETMFVKPKMKLTWSLVLVILAGICPVPVFYGSRFAKRRCFRPGHRSE